MKKLYTVTDIDELVARGQHSLSLGPDVILTPLARDRARELGVQLQTGPAPKSEGSLPGSYSSYPPQATNSVADNRSALVNLLQQIRTDVANNPFMARWLDELLRAVEQDDALRLDHTIKFVNLPGDRRQQVAKKASQAYVWANRLFGPESSHRRFDILWALTILTRALVK